MLQEICHPQMDAAKPEENVLLQYSITNQSVGAWTPWGQCCMKEFLYVCSLYEYNFIYTSDAILNLKHVWGISVLFFYKF
jgi:hypothetical protein